jgi:hypothetical protein
MKPAAPNPEAFEQGVQLPFHDSESRKKVSFPSFLIQTKPSKTVSVSVVMNQGHAETVQGKREMANFSPCRAYDSLLSSNVQPRRRHSRWRNDPRNGIEGDAISADQSRRQA